MTTPNHSQRSIFLKMEEKLEELRKKKFLSEFNKIIQKSSQNEKITF